MGLAEYKKKRNLKKSREPSAISHRPSAEKRLYVIQKHNASHLHYDLRLEFDGVLKSWAIPKLPPKVKGIKRLAIQVEDHPLSYAKFEGVIPEGNYGAGKVEIWDKGTFTVVNDGERGTENGERSIIVEIDGEKLKGEYCLVKTAMGDTPLSSSLPKGSDQNKARGKKNKWLFFKR